MTDPAIASHPAAAGSADPGGDAEVALNERRARIQDDLDWLLANMPESRAEARRRIAEVLELTPSPEMLQVLDTMASEDADAPSGALTRRLVLLRLLVDSELRDVTEPTVLEPEVLRRACGTLPLLEEEVEELSRELDWLPDSLDPREREHLDRLRRNLMPAKDQLTGFAAVVPRLERLARAAINGRILAVPHLGDREASLFADAIPRNIEADAGPERVRLEAAALRFGMLDNLETWDRLVGAERTIDDTSDGIDETAEESGDVENGPTEDDAAASPREDVERAAVEGARAEILERLRRDMTAYEVIVDRLQERQDEARAAGSAGAAREFAAAQRSLFSTYHRVATVVRNPDDSPGEDDEESAAARERLLREAGEAEAEAAEAPHLTKEEVFLEALTDLRDGATRNPEAVPVGAGELARERGRRKFLLTLAAILAVAAVAVNLALVRPRASASRMPTPEDFEPAMEVRQVVPIGNLMVSEVDSTTWESMSTEQREGRVDALGKLASEHGFEGVYLINGGMEEVAQWDSSDGVKLPEPAP